MGCDECHKRGVHVYNRLRMPVTLRSFAKINLGLCIGALRPDGFHDLRTVYQTIALYDVIRVEVNRGKGIEIRCEDPRVPRDASNTCYRVAELVMAALTARGRVVIEIEKRLPIQGGLGGASANAVATLLALERALKKELTGPGETAYRCRGGIGSASISDWRDCPWRRTRRGSLSAAGSAGDDLCCGDAGGWGFDSEGVCGLGFDDGQGCWKRLAALGWDGRRRPSPSESMLN